MATDWCFVERYDYVSDCETGLPSWAVRFHFKYHESCLLLYPGLLGDVLSEANAVRNDS